MFCIGTAGYSQTPYANENLLSPDLIGTARYVGMGGALGALGADISAISSNPAAIGLFRKGDVSLTFGFLTQHEKPALNTDMTHMSFDQIGFVFTTPVMGDAVKFVNFAFNYQKKANFNSAFIADKSRLNGLSQTQQMADLYNNRLSSPLADLMYEAYLIDPIDANGNILGDADDPNFDRFVGYDGWSNQFSRISEGGIYAFDFNLSTNIQDRVYLGLTLGIDRVNYNSYTTYSEQMRGMDNVTGSFVPLDMWYSQYDVHAITGYGVNVKLGTIIRPIENSAFRIGVTVESPTNYNLESAASYSLDSPYSGTGALLLHDPEVTHCAGMLNVRASAYFLGKIANGIYFDALAVLGVKLCSSAEIPGLVNRHHLAGDRKVLLDLLIDKAFNLGKLFLCHRTRTVEVKAETLGSDV